MPAALAARDRVPQNRERPGDSQGESDDDARQPGKPDDDVQSQLRSPAHRRPVISRREAGIGAGSRWDDPRSPPTFGKVKERTAFLKMRAGGYWYPFGLRHAVTTIQIRAGPLLRASVSIRSSDVLVVNHVPASELIDEVARPREVTVKSKPERPSDRHSNPPAHSNHEFQPLRTSPVSFESVEKNDEDPK